MQDGLGAAKPGSRIESMRLKPSSAALPVSLAARLFLAKRLALLGAIVLMTFSGVSLSAFADDRPPIFPLDQVKPGMAGVAYTNFAGDEIEKFDLTVIGVLPNLMGPKQSIILVQLHGPKVERTGVVAGMSGSPVYIDGKLAGALSLKFGVFTKDPIGGVTPIEDMLSIPNAEATPGTVQAAGALLLNGAPGPSQSAALEASSNFWALGAQRYPLPAQFAAAVGTGNAFLEPIAAPLVFSGFAPATIRQYSADWLPYGMMAAPGGTAAAEPDDAKIVPGDMVSVGLVDGDLSMSAACTVTAIVDGRVYACGHPLFGLGSIQMPLARGRTLTTLASDFDSTKIVNMGGLIGTLNQDRTTAIVGKLGASPTMIPVDLSVVTPAGERKFQMSMISNPKLTPLLVGIVAFNGLTQNTSYGEGNTLRLSGTIDIAGHTPVTLENMYAGTDQFVPDGSFVATSVQSIFTRIFSNPYEVPKINRVTLRVESQPERRIASILNAWSEMSEAEPGQSLLIKVLLRPYRGAPIIKDVPITIPPQAAPGSVLRVQVSDSDSLNRVNTLVAAQGRLGNLDQLITLLNRERRNNQLYVTLFNPTPTLLVDDKELPDAPLSEISILDQRRLPGTAVVLRESTAGEWSVPMDEVISGAASVSIKIK